MNTFRLVLGICRNSLRTLQAGLSVDLNRVKQLPGAPDHEEVTFNVGFDPRGAKLGLGAMSATIPINVSTG